MDDILVRKRLLLEHLSQLRATLERFGEEMDARSIGAERARERDQRHYFSGSRDSYRVAVKEVERVIDRLKSLAGYGDPLI